MEFFQEGDVVRLKSGGPAMTVIGSDAAENSYRCTWFDDKNQLQNAEFKSSSLERVEEFD